MANLTFETQVRGMETFWGRRRTLHAFGAALLTAMVGDAIAVDAKKNRGKRRTNRGNQKCPTCPVEDCVAEAQQAAAETCQAQVAPCETAIRRACDERPECIDRVLPCCKTLAVCDSESMLNCLLSLD